jgi:hypothetical protein
MIGDSIKSQLVIISTKKKPQMKILDVIYRQMSSFMTKVSTNLINNSSSTGLLIQELSWKLQTRNLAKDYY